LADKVVELNYIESVSHETVRRILKKKRNQALATQRIHKVFNDGRRVMIVG